jgi:outer membrane protein OmpA-like peptidoglycan-associated protein
MKRFLAAIFAVFLATPAVAAADSNVRDLTFTTQNLTFTTETLVFTVEDLYRVVETATETTIELPADVLFDFDKKDIRPDAALALKEAARILREQAKGPVRIEGHTDAKGAAGYNQTLSEQRATSVRQWLTDKEGLRQVSFSVRGFGATKPSAPNTNRDGSDNPEGRQKNRRVAIVFAKS